MAIRAILTPEPRKDQLDTGYNPGNIQLLRSWHASRFR